MQTRVFASSPSLSSPPSGRLPCTFASASTQLPRFQTPAMPNLMPSLGPFPYGGNQTGNFLGQSATSGTSIWQMDCMRELYTTRERIRQLEIENVKLMVERDTLRDVLNQKQIAMRDPVPFVPTRITHPNIKFWTPEDFDKWLMTPEGQAPTRGKEPFLEEESGDPVSDRRVSDIKASMRSAFCELVNTKRAPQVWGQIDATGRQTFHSLMEKFYPLFRCAENGWKLDRLARTTYPSWRWFHLDENMNWKSREEKKNYRSKRKGTGEETPRPSKLQRSDSEFNNVGLKGGDPRPSTSSSDSTTSGAPNSVIRFPGMVLSNPSVKVDPDAQRELDLVLPLQNIDEEMSSVERVNHSDSLQPGTAEHGITTSGDGNICNPMPALGNASVKMDDSQATSSSLLASSSHPSRKITKMRPSPTRNGRNLCAHRWLKAFKRTTNGTTSEFRQYYNSLSEEQRELYDKEAADLVSRNAWNRQAYNGTMY